MQIIFDKLDTELICHAFKEIDMSSANTFVEEVEKNIFPECKMLVFDFQHVEFMDSTGIGKLGGLIGKVQEDGIECKIVKCSPELEEVLDLIGIFELL